MTNNKTLKIDENLNGDYNYHSTQIDLPNLKEFTQLQSQIHPNVIYEDPNDSSYGLENDPHITVCYGIKEESDYFLLRNKLKDIGSIVITFGEISTFRTENKPYDVLIVRIISSQLKVINSFIRRLCDPYVSFPDYNPHMTLGYIKKGTCVDLEGPCSITGESILINTIQFSHRDKYKIEIPLC